MRPRQRIHGRPARRRRRRSLAPARRFPRRAWRARVCALSLRPRRGTCAVWRRLLRRRYRSRYLRRWRRACTRPALVARTRGRARASARATRRVATPRAGLGKRPRLCGRCRRALRGRQPLLWRRWRCAGRAPLRPPLPLCALRRWRLRRPLRRGRRRRARRRARVSPRGWVRCARWRAAAVGGARRARACTRGSRSAAAVAAAGGGLRRRAGARHAGTAQPTGSWRRGRPPSGSTATGRPRPGLPPPFLRGWRASSASYPSRRTMGRGRGCT